MSEKINGLHVVLYKDISKEEAESLINIIKNLRNVLSVEKNESNFDCTIAFSRAKSEIWRKLFNALNEDRQL